MKTITEQIRDHLLHPMSFEELQKSEWSSLFEQLMRNRLIMGAYRYGRMQSAGKPQYDRVRAIREHLHGYAETGNLEHLVDVANLALVEFVEGDHPQRNFHSVDDGAHAQKKT